MCIRDSQILIEGHTDSVGSATANNLLSRRRADAVDTALVAIVDKLIKQRKDSIEAYQKAQRQDLADKEAAEMSVLQAYLPARLSADEIKATVATLVQALAAELGRPLTGADMGKIMGAAKAQFTGKADMGQVSAAIKAALAG